MLKNITILGGRGMLGSDIVVEMRKHSYAVRVYDLPEFDITNHFQLESVIKSSEIVINCAAYTNVEKAEDEFAKVNIINGYAVGELGQLAKRYDTKVLHISTDFVFDGLKEGAYHEMDICAPLNNYGQSKRLGEIKLFKSNCKCCVVRLQWTYGKGGSNFITKILNASKERKELKVVDDQIGSPTSTRMVATVLLDLLSLKSFPRGLFHLSANGFVSRYEMARCLLGSKIVPCKTSDYETKTTRPLNSCFDCSKIETLLGYKLSNWKLLLDDYIRTL